MLQHLLASVAASAPASGGGGGGGGTFAWDSNYTPDDYTVTGKQVTNNGVADSDHFIVADAPLTGKKYWEIEYDGSVASTYFGVTDETNRDQYEDGDSTLRKVGQGVGEYTSNFSRVWQDGGNNGDPNGVLEVPPFVDNSTVMVAFDASTGEFWFGVDGVWNGDPGAGTDPAMTKADYTAPYVALNIRQNGTSATIHTTSDECDYAVPSGFSTLE